MLTATYRKYNLQFNQPAGTSRGFLTEKVSWFLIISDSKGATGIGECSLLPGLSPDYREGYQATLDRVCATINRPHRELLKSLTEWPSIRFGLEMALADLAGGGNRILFSTPFISDATVIPINGLIWMGDRPAMLRQVEDKLRQGYRVLKMKVGAIDFEAECSILAAVREQFGPETVTLRLDANGAFSAYEAMAKLEKLARYQIHSIEQPILPGQPETMRLLCQNSPIPVALDEELIGCYDPVQQEILLDQIKPQFIILKPSLLGGFAASEQWIAAAERRGIGWWVTSALESNVGLNAIAQWTAAMEINLPQGLGTGSLYSNNISSPLLAEKGVLRYQHDKDWDLRPLGMELPDHWKRLSLRTATSVLSGEPLLHLMSEWRNSEDKVLQETASFMLKWLDDSEVVEVNTSGSTGSPKKIELSKMAMIASAHSTAQSLGLYQHQSALLSLSVNTVAGMMMVIRAMVCDLRLEFTSPGGHPLRDLADDNIPEFAAMVPAQVYNALKDRSSAEKLRRIRTLLIGGGQLPATVEAALKSFPTAVYHSYGMTETYSHIALRRVNGPLAGIRYRLLPGVSVTTDQRGCLVIDAPHLGIAQLVTNDLVKLQGATEFEWLGRFDNVINRGGQKLIAETLEARLGEWLKEPFFIAPLPHAKLGEVPVLIIEGPPYSANKMDALMRTVNQRFEPRERPVSVGFILRFARVSGGKINRATTLALTETELDNWINLV